MRKNLFKIITIILSVIFVVLVVILITMKVVNGKEKEDRELLTAKIADELSFIDYNVIDAMNKLNNITVTRYKVFSKTINNKDNSTNSSSKDSSNDKSSSNSESQGQENSSEGDNNQSTNEGSSEGDSSSSGKSSSGGNSSNEASKNSSGSSNKSNEKESQISLVNSLTETDDEEPDWDTITNIYENLLSTWPTTQLDLKKAGISDEYLENINVDLNGIAQSILNKDKNSCLINLYNLYSQIPTYMEIISTDKYATNLYNTKMAILNAYSLANNDNKWNEVTSSIKSATSQFEKIVNSKNDKKERENLERIYSMLKNLENTVVLNNKNIFYMQYKNIMQEISNL